MKKWFLSTIIWTQIFQAIVSIFGIIKPIVETMIGHALLFDISSILSNTTITFISGLIVFILSLFTTKQRITTTELIKTKTNIKKYKGTFGNGTA